MNTSCIPKMHEQLTRTPVRYLLQKIHNALPANDYAPATHDQQILESTRPYINELARRAAALSLYDGPVFQDPDAVKQYLHAELQHRERETFWVLYLNNQHELLHSEALFQGTLDSAAIHPREVVKGVLEHNAAAVILAHNHPSGLLEPSQADRRITDRLVNALALIDVRVLDHFVTGRNGVVSFAERGWV